MKFVKVSDEGNAHGWDVIEFLQFNYDGKGSAIARRRMKNEEWDYSDYGIGDIMDIIDTTSDYHENPIYKMIKN
jgi:predicted alpha/beta hydrolase